MLKKGDSVPELNESSGIDCCPDGRLDSALDVGLRLDGGLDGALDIGLDCGLDESLEYSTSSDANRLLSNAAILKSKESMGRLEGIGIL